MNPDGSGRRARRGRWGTATCRAAPGTARAAVGERVRPEHARRGQPDPARAQLRVAGGRGRRRRRSGGRFTNPQVTWATSEASPSGAAIIGSNLYVAALQGECVWRIPLRRRVAGQADADARRPLRAHPDRRRGARRHALGGDVQPRRPRLPALGRRPDRRRSGLSAARCRQSAVDADDTRPAPRRAAAAGRIAAPAVVERRRASRAASSRRRCRRTGRRAGDPSRRSDRG